MTANTSMPETALFAVLGALKDQSNVGYIGTDIPTLGAALQLGWNTVLNPYGNPTYTGYNAKVVTSLLQKAIKLPPGAAYNKVLNQVNTIIDQQVPIVDLVVPGQQNVTRSNIVGYRVYAYPTMYYDYLHPRGA